MVLEPIAMVKNNVKEMGRRDWDKVVSQLILRPNLEDALDGLEEFSHLIVLFGFISVLRAKALPTRHTHRRELTCP